MKLFIQVCSFLLILTFLEAKDFDSFEKFLDISVAKGEVAGGVILVHHKNEVVFNKGFGYADLESKKEFKVDTPVIVASISKPIVGTVIHKLMDLGKLNTENSVIDYLPEFKQSKLEGGEALKRMPSVSELLMHRAGLRGDEDEKGRIWFQSWTRGLALSEVIDKVILDIPFKAQPNTRYAYSGIGTDIAARVGELASGMKRNEMLIEYFSKPLDMKHTYFRSDRRHLESKGSMPTRYFRDKASCELMVYKGRPFPSLDTYSSSGGTVISRATDLLNWLLMIKNGGLHQGEVYLRSKTHEKLLNKHPISNIAEGGLFVRDKYEDGKPKRYGHTGSSGTNVWIDFELDLIGIMLTQTKGKDIRDFRIKVEKEIDMIIKSE